LSIIALIEAPSSGRLTLFDTDIAAADRKTRAALRRRIGIVFQDLRLLDHLSAADNIALPLRIAGMPDTEIREYVEEVADWLGIGDRIGLFPDVLSPGERRRVAVARAVVGRPDLLVADEPLSRVDDETAALLMRAFEQLNRVGTTVLIAAPDSDIIRRSPHPRIHLEEGRWAGRDTDPESRPERRITS
jgi:cell division transport system ATP-binding protein